VLARIIPPPSTRATTCTRARKSHTSARLLGSAIRRRHTPSLSPTAPTPPDPPGGVDEFASLDARRESPERDPDLVVVRPSPAPVRAEAVAAAATPGRCIGQQSALVARAAADLEHHLTVTAQIVSERKRRRRARDRPFADGRRERRPGCLKRCSRYKAARNWVRSMRPPRSTASSSRPA
jgi:hypothetical protein